jgi:hypothetical protein
VNILGNSWAVCTNVTHTHARRKVGGPTPRFDGKRASRAEAASAGPSNLPAGLYGELIATFLQKEEVVIVKMKVDVKSDENRIRVTSGIVRLQGMLPFPLLLDFNLLL